MSNGTNNIIRSKSKDIQSYLPETKLSQEISAFSVISREKAQLVIKETMPSKIIYLTNLLKQKNDFQEFFEAREAKTLATDCGADSDPKRQKLFLTGSFEFARKEFKELETQVLELVQIASTVKLWLQLNVPKIEDGNNFGVGIQTDIIGELARVEDSALAAVENWCKFLMMRSKIISKIEKHSSSESVKKSYEESLESYDVKQVRSVLIGWMDLRNNYSIIYDLIIKNLDKLLSPRSQNSSSMY